MTLTIFIITQKNDNFCCYFNNACVTSYLKSNPQIKSRRRDMPSWKKHVEPERDSSLFCNLIWLEADTPSNGIVYDVMSGAHHHTVHCYKKTHF